MKHKILVSIIMPSYNASLYIEEAIFSVQKQTYSNWELIITDDCSKDNSFELAKKIAENDSRIKVYKLEKNGGTAVARNNSLKYATGKYITFLDSDDTLDPTYLEEQIKFMEETGGPIVSSGYRRAAENSTTNFNVPRQINYKKLLKGNHLSCLSTMFDRERFPNIYFPEDMLKCEDYVFWLRILKTGCYAYGNPKVLATYRILQNSKSRKKLPLIKYMYIVYRKKENLSFFKTIVCLFNWALYGIRKYKDVK